MLTIKRSKLLVVTAIAVAVAACRRQEPTLLERTFTEHQKSATIRLAAVDSNRWWTLNEISQRLMRRLNETLSTQEQGSDVTRINRVGTTARIQISRDTFRLLDLAQHYSALSGGAFDFTTAPLAYLWGFQGGPTPTNVPPPDTLLAALVGVGAQNLTLFDLSAVALTHIQSKMSVDSLIDAYTTDLIVIEAREKGVANAFVNIGDNARALGIPEAGKTWEWTLASPFKTNESLGTLLLAPGVAISQSRLHETNVTIEGKTYGHIIDPRTGRPAEGTALAIAAGPTATQGAALAEALVVAGLHGAGAVLSHFPRCDAMIVPDRQPVEIWMTKNFASRVRLNPELEQAVHVIETPKAAESVIDDDVSEARDASPTSPAPAAK